MKSEYRPLPKWLWFFRIALCFCISSEFYFIASWITGIDLLGGSPLTQIQRMFSAPLSIVICLNFVVQCFYCGFFEHVVFSKDGIQYDTTGYKVHIPWSNVTRIGMYRSGIFKFDGIFATYFSQDLKLWFPGSAFLGKEIFIPLSMFAKDWRNTELGQQIRQYAPHLFRDAI
jgi:hypothetical protein